MVIYDALVISYDLRGMLMRVVIVFVNRPDEDQSVCCGGAVGASKPSPHCCTCTKMWHSVLDNRTDLASGSAAVFALCRLSFPHHNCDHTLTLSPSASLSLTLSLSLSLSLALHLSLPLSLSLSLSPLPPWGWTSWPGRLHLPAHL